MEHNSSIMASGRMGEMHSGLVFEHNLPRPNYDIGDQQEMVVCCLYCSLATVKDN